jgi:hypothetical protein
MKSLPLTYFREIPYTIFINQCVITFTDIKVHFYCPSERVTLAMLNRKECMWLDYTFQLLTLRRLRHYHGLNLDAWSVTSFANKQWRASTTETSNAGIDFWSVTKYAAGTYVAHEYRPIFYYLFLFRSARSTGLRQCLAIRGSCFSFLDPLDIW